jgi:hypothetical protein
MEISDIRRRVVEVIGAARRAAAERRSRTDEATRDYERFLEKVAVPVFRQVANVLKAQGYAFGVATPGGSVRLSSERNGQDFIELALDTGGDMPRVIGHIAHERGRRVLETEEPIADVAVRDLTDEDVLAFVLKALGPFVER